MIHLPKRSTRLGVIALLAALLFPYAISEATGETAGGNSTPFQLFSGCWPMNLRVVLSSEAEEIGVTEASVQAAVESRLRAANLYAADTLAYLDVFADVVGPAFSIRLEYKKAFEDIISQELGYATTWSIGGLGIHNRNPRFIRDNISEYTDIFLVQFLRVNEEACAKR